jgi:hypothetical protein
MRTTEERVLAVEKRVQELAEERFLDKKYILLTGSIAASLLFILSLSFAMPTLLDSMPDGDYSNFLMTASIFNANNVFGFVLVGFLAFVLGISVTILAYKIKEINQFEERNIEDIEKIENLEDIEKQKTWIQ